MDERHIIGVPSRVRQQLRHPGTRLPMLPPGERRRQTSAAGLEEPGARIGAGERLAVAALQFGLVVEGIDLRRATGHEEPDDRADLRREVRLLTTLLTGALLMKQRR